MDRIDKLWNSLILLANEIGILKAKDNFWREQYYNVSTLLKLIWTFSVFKSLFIIYLLLRLNGELGGCL